MTKLYLLALLILAQGSAWSAYATDHSTQSSDRERVYMDKIVILSDGAIRARCIEREYSTAWIDHNGVQTTRKLISLEIVLGPEGIPTGSSRRVWRNVRFRTDDNIITGSPVVALIALAHQDESDQLLLAVTNTYYPGVHVFTIDPAVAIPPLEEVYRQHDSGQWTPSLSPPTPFLTVPRTIEKRGGVRTVEISASNGTVSLVVNHATCDEPTQYVYTRSTRSWNIEQMASGTTTKDDDIAQGREN